MKAYIVGIKDDPDRGNEIIFAKNTKEARKIAHNTELSSEADRWIDIEVYRAPAYDDTENLSGKDLMLKQWREGWWFFDDAPMPPEEHTDEEFYTWYDKTYSKEGC